MEPAMSEQRSTETINVSDVRQQFATVLNSVFRNERRVLLEKSGIPVAAMVSVDDLRRLEQLEARASRAADDDSERGDSEGRGKKKKKSSKSH
jgi:prevent-host-death family protein